MIAEGVVLDVDPNDLASLHEVERDAHGNLRIAEVNIGEILKAQVAARLRALGMKATLVAKNIGYELRCADPIPTTWSTRATWVTARPSSSWLAATPR
jgi:6-phosphofructokinase 1